MSGRVMVMSSAGLAGVPLSSTTRTLVSGTLPQLVTIPLNGIEVVPNGTDAGHVLVALMHGLLQTLQVAVTGGRGCSPGRQGSVFDTVFPVLSVPCAEIV